MIWLFAIVALLVAAALPVVFYLLLTRNPARDEELRNLRKREARQAELLRELHDTAVSYDVQDTNPAAAYFRDKIELVFPETTRGGNSRELQ